MGTVDGEATEQQERQCVHAVIVARGSMVGVMRNPADTMGLGGDHERHLGVISFQHVVGQGMRLVRGTDPFVFLA